MVRQVERAIVATGDNVIGAGDDNGVMNDDEWEKFKQGIRGGALAAQGVVARADEPVVDKMRESVGLPPIVIRRGKVTKTSIDLSEEAVIEWRRLAESFKYLRGGRGNVSAFIEAIGQKKFTVVRVEDEGGGVGEGGELLGDMRTLLG